MFTASRGNEMSFSYSKIITAIPLLIGALLILVEYATDFTVTESQIQLVEFMIGGTILGGVANSGFKKFKDYKEKQNGN